MVTYIVSKGSYLLTLCVYFLLRKQYQCALLYICEGKTADHNHPSSAEHMYEEVGVAGGQEFTQYSDKFQRSIWSCCQEQYSDISKFCLWTNIM